ncbi:hypothetical protein ACX40Y_05645 [Sphingomonas sp. RS6]
MPTDTEARDALAAMNATRAQLARAAHCPPARHAAFALLMAAVVLSPVAMPYQLVALAPVLVGIVLVVRWDRRRLGMFVNGYRRGRTRRVIAAILPGFLLLYGASVYAVAAHGLLWPSVALAVLAFALGYFGSLMWQRVFVRELGLAA